METRQPYPVPSVLQIVATDGHVAFLIGMGLGLTVFLALLWAVEGTTRVPDLRGGPILVWHWVTVFAPQVLLVLPALLWARSIQAVFQRGIAVSGTVTRQRVGLYGLLVIDFYYLTDGGEHRHSNHLVPLAHTKFLTPDTEIWVLLPRSRFPGPLIRDAYVRSGRA